MRRRDLLGGVWKRVEEHRAELRAQRIADRKRETAERLDAGGTVQLPKREQPGAGPSEGQPGAAPRNARDEQ